MGRGGRVSMGWMLTVYGTVRVVQKKLEASFSQNELKDMPGQSLYMHTGLNFTVIHTMIFGFLFCCIFCLKKLQKFFINKNGGNNVERPSNCTRWYFHDLFKNWKQYLIANKSFTHVIFYLSINDLYEDGENFLLFKVKSAQLIFVHF